MTAFIVCPFCGIASEQAHDSQQACIAALHSEIQKTRELLAAVDGARTDPPEATGGREVQTT